MRAGNLLADVAGDSENELFETIVHRPGVRVERIVSTGQASAPGFWFDQDWTEWVVVVSGAAGLTIEGESTRALRAGDWIELPARTRHRVEWTEAPTVWLAVHFDETC